jgi:hypothetical protein
MDLSYDYLQNLGFRDFIHLRRADRDGAKRMSWMQIINEEIVTIRIIFINNLWGIEYVNPNKYFKKLNTIDAVINFISTNGAD